MYDIARVFMSFFQCLQMMDFVDCGVIADRLHYLHQAHSTLVEDGYVNDRVKCFMLGLIKFSTHGLDVKV